MYKVTKFIYENSVDGAFRIRKYITVKENITFAEAKNMRRSDRDLQIVKMR